MANQTAPSYLRGRLTSGASSIASSARPSWRLGRRPALDGLRGVAILLVLLDHLRIPAFEAAGGVGVTMFFCLSGFLITCLLLEERADNGAISLRGFFVRRARRLLPALSVFLLVMLVCGLLISPKIATPTSVALVLLYLGNWVQAAGTDFGGLAHTWSLAVEEQFYVIWPIVVLTVTRKAWRHALLWIAAVGACLSAVARLLLWDGGAGATRIYNGSDTRADAILLGCLLGAALHKGREGVNRPGLATLALVAAGALSLTHDFGRLVVLPTVVPVLTVLAIWALTRAKQYSGWLSSRGLVAIGKRSYGFYLWHWPVQFILLRVDAVTEHRLLHWFLLLTLSWSLTVLSWRYVEQPFLNGRWRGAPRPAVVPA